MTSAVRSGLPSMSKSALLLSPCTRWADPRAKWYDESKVEFKERDEGTMFHEAMDQFSQTLDHKKDYPEGVMRRLAHSTKWYLEELVPRCKLILSEQAVAVDWLSGEARFLGPIKNRQYPTDMPGFMFGTADLVCVTNDNELLVADWKTGGTDGAKEQLASLAWGLLKSGRFDMLDNDTCVVTVKTLCLPVNEHGVWPDEALLMPSYLDTHFHNMQMATLFIDRMFDKPRAGVHCTAFYCPHLAFCPTITAATNLLAQSAPSGVPEAKKGLPVIMEPSNGIEAGETMALVSAAKRQLNYVTEHCKAMAKRGEKIVYGDYEFADGGNGYRWRKSSRPES